MRHARKLSAAARRREGENLQDQIVAALSENSHDARKEKDTRKRGSERLQLPRWIRETHTNPPSPTGPTTRPPKSTLEGGATLHLVLALRGGSSS